MGYDRRIYILASLLFAVAANSQENLICNLDANAAQLACTTEDMQAGMQDGGARARSLRSQLDSNHEKVSANQKPMNAALHCENQISSATRLAEMSRLKADACQSALTKCAQSCGESADVLEIAAGLGGGGAESFVRGASQFRQSQRRCQGYNAQVLAARQQSQERETAAKTNEQCHRRSASFDHSAPSEADSTRPNGNIVLTDPSLETPDRAAKRSHSTVSPHSEPSITRTPTSLAGGGEAIVHELSSSNIETLGSERIEVERRTVRHSEVRRKVAGSIHYRQGDPQLNGPGDNQPILNAQPARRDGITGPTGPSLFEKVAEQYRRQANTMLD